MAGAGAAICGLGWQQGCTVPEPPAKRSYQSVENTHMIGHND
jgi:hypothetical protein